MPLELKEQMQGTRLVTKRLWKDQRMSCKETLLTTLVRGQAIDSIQKACCQSIAVAWDVLLRHEEWKYLWNNAWARNQDNGTTDNTLCLVANITRCLQRMDATCEDALTIRLKDNETSHSSEEKTGSSTMI